MMKNNKTFGLNLRHLRNISGLSQAELALQLNVSRSAVASYENNLRNPDFKTLVKIAHYFEVSIDYLLGMDGHDFGMPTKYRIIIDEIDNLFKSSSLSPAKKEEILNDLLDYLKWKVYQSR